MARSRLIRPLHDWLLVTHLLVFSLPLIVLVGTGALARDLRRQTVEDISHQAVLVALHIESSVARQGGPPDVAMMAMSAELSDLLKTVKDHTGASLDEVRAHAACFIACVPASRVLARPETPAERRDVVHIASHYFEAKLYRKLNLGRK